VAPTSKPFPRFVADTSQERRPHGRWEERLLEALSDRCAGLADEAGASLDTENVRWFPERTWGERTYIPATSRTAGPDGGTIEYFGHVSYRRVEGEEPTDLRASADFTDVTVEDNPDWKIDINDEVIGSWRSDGSRGGEMTLIWGVPLVRGAFAATAELEGEVLDQCAVEDGRFTLIAVDAVTGFGDELYLKVHLWDRRLRPVAAESLYDEPGAPEPEPDEPDPPAGDAEPKRED
jgi:hypothetical protein